MENKNVSEILNGRFKKELEYLLNRYSIDNECNIPDYVLANYIVEYIKSIKGDRRKKAQTKTVRELCKIHGIEVKDSFFPGCDWP